MRAGLRLGAGHTVGADEDVLGLHVPVDDAVRMQIAQGLHQLPGNVLHFLLWQLPVILQHLKELP